MSRKRRIVLQPVGTCVQVQVDGKQLSLCPTPGPLHDQGGRYPQLTNQAPSAQRQQQQQQRVGLLGRLFGRGGQRRPLVTAPVGALAVSGEQRRPSLDTFQAGENDCPTECAQEPTYLKCMQCVGQTKPLMSGEFFGCGSQLCAGKPLLFAANQQTAAAS